MAIWQWDIWIVPRKEVLKYFPVVPEYMEQDWFESTDWWNDVSEVVLGAFFGTVLPDYHAPWAMNTKSWGSDDGNRIELSVENGMVTNVAIRIDLRNLSLNFLNSLVIFSEVNDFLFYSLEFNKFTEPNLDSLLSEIRRSRKIIFLQNPEEFFENKKYLDKINKENRKKLDKDL